MQVFRAFWRGRDLRKSLGDCLAICRAPRLSGLGVSGHSDDCTFGESTMLPNLAAEIAALPRLRVSELRIKFAEVCGEPTPSHNKVWLVKRIAWRLQAKAEGDLSERARRRVTELIADADLRLSAPPAAAGTATPEPPAILRVPPPDPLPPSP